MCLMLKPEFIANMNCVACHDMDRNNGGQVISHGIGGMPYHSVDEGNMKQCVDCHAPSSRLHKGKVRKMVNTHDRLACQVCHIPAIAREVSTKVEWYGSDAGQDIEETIKQNIDLSLLPLIIFCYAKLELL